MIMIACTICFFGLISVCISQNNHKVVTKGSQTDPKVVTMRLPSKWQPIDPSVVTKWLSTHRLVTKRPLSYPDVVTDPKLIPN